MKTISRLLQFIIGFIVGISILGGVGFAAGYYFFTKMAATPPRPVFAEEQNKDKTSEGDSAGEEKEESKTDVAATEEEEEQEKQEGKEEEEKEEELEPGAYKAKVNWPEGLILRDKPGEDAEQLSGIAFDEEVIVLKESEDGRWQQVRIPNSDRQGWIKGGNVDKVE